MAGRYSSRSPGPPVQRSRRSDGMRGERRTRPLLELTSFRDARRLREGEAYDEPPPPRRSTRSVVGLPSHSRLLVSRTEAEWGRRRYPIDSRSPHRGYLAEEVPLDAYGPPVKRVRRRCQARHYDADDLGGPPGRSSRRHDYGRMEEYAERSPSYGEDVYRYPSHRDVHNDDYYYDEDTRWIEDRGRVSRRAENGSAEERYTPPDRGNARHSEQPPQEQKEAAAPPERDAEKSGEPPQKAPDEALNLEEEGDGAKEGSVKAAEDGGEASAASSGAAKSAEEPPDSNRDILFILKTECAKIIGTQGAVLKHIEKQTFTRVQVAKEADPGGDPKERMVEVFGRRPDRPQAIKMIMEYITFARDSEGVVTKDTRCAAELPLVVNLNQEGVSRLIGRKGENIQRIEKESCAHIDVDKLSGRLEICGPKDAQERCLELVLQSVSYVTDADGKVLKDEPSPPPAAPKVPPPPPKPTPAQQAKDSPGSAAPVDDDLLRIWVKDKEVGKIIGRGGETIKEVMDATLTNIQVQKGQDVDPGCSIREVSIKGPSAAQRLKARDLILELVSWCQGPGDEGVLKDEPIPPIAGKSGNGKGQVVAPPRPPARHKIPRPPLPVKGKGKGGKNGCKGPPDGSSMPPDGLWNMAMQMGMHWGVRAPMPGMHPGMPMGMMGMPPMGAQSSMMPMPGMGHQPMIGMSPAGYMGYNQRTRSQSSSYSTGESGSSSYSSEIDLGSTTGKAADTQRKSPSLAPSVAPSMAADLEAVIADSEQAELALFNAAARSRSRSYEERQPYMHHEEPRHHDDGFRDDFDDDFRDDFVGSEHRRSSRYADELPPRHHEDYDRYEVMEEDLHSDRRRDAAYSYRGSGRSEERYDGYMDRRLRRRSRASPLHREALQQRFEQLGDLR
mmetsp:Transcript_119/g.177  ORF Transcript_119/g.177 Transcript_119/m.177 type:complete len:897 (+) Transcript_119:55-2745(+)